MTPQAKGLQIGSAIGVALCGVFLLRWWMMPAQGGWHLSEDGTAWEATRDVHGAAILPERRYRLSGTGSAPAEVAWTMRATDGDGDVRTASAGDVSAGEWQLVMRAGTDAPRRAIVTVRVAPSSAVDAESLTLQLTR
jgi:hypothetical protein